MGLFQWQLNFFMLCAHKIAPCSKSSFSLSVFFLPGSLCDAVEPKLYVQLAFTSVGFVAVLTLSFD